jgi:hypothetical protein
MSLLQQTIEATKPASQKFRKLAEKRILKLPIPQLWLFDSTQIPARP